MRATFLLLCRMTVYSVNDETPNMAMLGCEVLIPATLIAQLPDEPSKPVTPYVTSFRCTLREVHQKIPQNTGTVAKTQKHYFDKYITCSPFHVDQLAWLYQPQTPLRQQENKTQRLWSGPWRTVEFQTPIVVVIQNIKTLKHQTVYVDKLAPCRSQQLEPTENTVRSDLTDQSCGPGDQNSGPTKVRKSGRVRRPPSYLNSYSQQ